MTHQEIREQIAASMEEVSKRTQCERYENEREFVGPVLGEAVPAVPSMALALSEAAEDGCCGTCCDSNCGCP